MKIVGYAGPMGLVAYLLGSGTVMTWLRKPTGRFTVNEQQLEGNYRAVNARLLRYCEEVAFYRVSNNKCVFCVCFNVINLKIFATKINA